MKTILDTPLVSVAWLSKNFENPDLIILDATIPKVAGSKPKDILISQIKGARFFDIKGRFSDKETNIPNMLPSPKIFAQNCSELGLTNNHAVIVYDQLGMYSSARVWWMFKIMGYDNVAVLDGGLPTWQEANLPVEPFDPESKSAFKGNFEAHFRPELVVDKDDIFSQIHNQNTLIIDARSEGRFNAVEPEPRADLKGGHIPNSKSLHYAKVFRDNKMLPVGELKEIFKNFDIEHKKLIFTCGSGITACIILLAAELIGYKNVSVYDGSWSEWGQLDGAPIEC